MAAASRQPPGHLDPRLDSLGKTCTLPRAQQGGRSLSPFACDVAFRSAQLEANRQGVKLTHMGSWIWIARMLGHPP